MFVGITAFMSALVCADRLYHYYIAFYYRHLAGGKPEDKFAHPALPPVDSAPPEAFPRVVVQLPMFNETEVCRMVIDAACEMTWPRGRLLVQILDDSTDEVCRERIQDAVAAWREAGVNIVYRWRSNREGYKAGAMSEAMADIAEYEHIAIFDADFHPEPDFLLKTIPYLVVRICICICIWYQNQLRITRFAHARAAAPLPARTRTTRRWVSCRRGGRTPTAASRS